MRLLSRPPLTHNRMPRSRQRLMGPKTWSLRSVFFLLILAAAAAALFCTVMYRAFPSTVSPARWFLDADGDPDPLDFNRDNEDARLERVLKVASMENKTIILTTLNAAWSSPGSVLDLFLESFLNGEQTRLLLKHLVIVALDLKAYKRCTSIHPHCFALLTEGVDFSGEKNFMSDGYLTMMWRRIEFLRLVLEKGYSFIFSDADIMWFRNPLRFFYPDVDFQIACDHFVGDPTDLRNTPNGGFIYVKSNKRSIKFYEF